MQGRGPNNKIRIRRGGSSRSFKRRRSSYLYSYIIFGFTFARFFTNRSFRVRSLLRTDTRVYDRRSRRFIGNTQKTIENLISLSSTRDTSSRPFGLSLHELRRNAGRQIAFHVRIRKGTRKSGDSPGETARGFRAIRSRESRRSSTLSR